MTLHGVKLRIRNSVVYRLWDRTGRRLGYWVRGAVRDQVGIKVCSRVWDQVGSKLQGGEEVASSTPVPEGGRP